MARQERQVTRRSRVPALLMFVGAPLIVFGLSYLHAHVVAVPTYLLADTGQFGWIALYSGLVVLACYAVGLPEEPRSLLAAAGRAVVAGALAAAAISIIGLFIASTVLPRFVVFGTWLALVPWSVLSNWTVGTAALRGTRTGVLVVANNDEIAALDADMRRDLERPAEVIGTISTIEASASGTPLTDLAASAGPTMVVVSATGLASRRIVEQVAVLHESGIRVRSLPDFYQDWMGKLPAGEVERSSLLFDIGEVHGRSYGRLKRLADIVGASIMMVPLLTLAPLVWLANLAGNRGPLFYRQPRVGRNDTVFNILKFRTMEPGSHGSAWTAHDDPRITPVGAWLRRSHLDELPQAINVLRGELSLVGPRPEQPAYVAELTEKLPYYHLRHVVRPGLTGWAQVKYPYGASEQDAFEKLQFDFFYLRHQGFAMDLRCVARTLRTVTRAKGR
mgnify:CR=1 FL=1